MWKDEIVFEVRQIRDALSKRLDYDIDRIIDAAQARQNRSGHRVVSFAKRKKARPDAHATSRP